MRLLHEPLLGVMLLWQLSEPGQLRGHPPPPRGLLVSGGRVSSRTPQPLSSPSLPFDPQQRRRGSLRLLRLFLRLPGPSLVDAHLSLFVARSSACPKHSYHL